MYIHHFIKRIHAKVLSIYPEDDLFTYKKAEMMLYVSFLILLACIASAIAHYPLFPKNPLLFSGDLLLIFGLLFSLFFIFKGKLVSAGTLVMIFAIINVMLQNVIGDVLGPAEVTKSRFIETLIFIFVGYPIAVSFALKRFQLLLYMLFSTLVLISHFVVLKYVICIDIGYDYLIFLVSVLLPGLISIINFNLINKSINTLVWTKAEIEKWNHNLEQIVLDRTNELEKANRKLEAMSMTDGLTEIANRRKFNNQLQTDWDRSVLSNGNLTVMILDIDHFKQFNDSFGHLQGDLCLQQVAKKLEFLALGEKSFVARYGGEEFGIILPEVSIEEALQFAELVRSEIEALGIPQPTNAKHPVVTVSIGVSSHPVSTTESPEDILKEADAALYKAKKNGRNRVELASPHQFTR